MHAGCGEEQGGGGGGQGELQVMWRLQLESGARAKHFWKSEGKRGWSLAGCWVLLDKSRNCAEMKLSPRVGNRALSTGGSMGMGQYPAKS